MMCYCYLFTDLDEKCVKLWKCSSKIILCRNAHDLGFDGSSAKLDISQEQNGTKMIINEGHPE